MGKLFIDLAKLRYNAGYMKSFCVNRGLEVVGVVKGCNGHPSIIDAFQEAGIENLGLSRMSVARSAASKLKNKPTLIAFHAKNEASAIPWFFRTSFNSELASIRALAAEADLSGCDHEIILMVEAGDLREGVMPEDVLGVVRQILEIKTRRLEFRGLGANFGCCSGALPDARNLALLQELALDIEKRLGYDVRTVSVGGTVLLDWLENNELPSKINQLRIGEAILMGNNLTANKKIDYLFSDVFTLKGEILELREKPSAPLGRQGLDALGRTPVFIDRGIRKRAILNFGVLDTDPASLTPREKNIEIVNSNSEYTIVDVTDCDPPLRKGEILAFDPGYTAMARAFISPYVDIEVVNKDGVEEVPGGRDWLKLKTDENLEPWKGEIRGGGEAPRRISPRHRSSAHRRTDSA
ncbi:MAG: amino-acid racemase [Desulfobacterales bacterium]|nr:amino-acid racemase [Desulfobacterales bacterium]